MKTDILNYTLFPPNVTKSSRLKCLDCAGGVSAVKNCEFVNCNLYPYRFGKNPYRGKEKPKNYLPPLKAIRAECFNCNYTSAEVEKCPCTTCALWPYRFGINPFVSNKKRAQGRKSISNLKNRPHHRGNDDDLTEAIPEGSGMKGHFFQPP